MNEVREFNDMMRTAKNNDLTIALLRGYIDDATYFEEYKLYKSYFNMMNKEGEKVKYTELCSFYIKDEPVPSLLVIIYSDLDSEPKFKTFLKINRRFYDSVRDGTYRAPLEEGMVSRYTPSSAEDIMDLMLALDHYKGEDYKIETIFIINEDNKISNVKHEKIRNSAIGNKSTYFSLDEMMINPVLHCRTPLMQKIERGSVLDKERIALEVDYHIENISKNDPVVKFHGWSVGDYIVIHCNSSELCTLNKVLTYYKKIV